MNSLHSMMAELLYPHSNARQSAGDRQWISRVVLRKKHLTSKFFQIHDLRKLYVTNVTNKEFIFKRKAKQLEMFLKIMYIH